MTYTYSAFAPAGYPSFVLPTKITRLIAPGDAVDETISYNAANHYLPQTKVVDAGAGKLNLATPYSYDASGNMAQLDGPRSTSTM
ncbi:MAG: hypothetical protein IPI73_24355 [Betaproteobacteria bacterium]|nr:hypothetical protein [Betaproteobacteria bacterium]